MSQAGVTLGSLHQAIEEEVGRQPSLLRSVTGSTEGRLGLSLLVLILLVIFAGPLVAPYPPTEIGVALDNSGPSLHHLLGTDQLGRDVLSRFLTGGIQVLVLPVLSVALALLAGGVLGMIGAYRGGAVDNLVSRLFELILIMPPLLFVIVLVAAFGSSTLVIVLSVALVYVPQFGRLVRGASQSIVTADYVAAAVARGEGTRSILLRDIAPNVATPVIAEVALRITFAIMFVATLDFLGLGTQPPSSAWGLMVSDGRAIITVAPLVSLAPAAGIAVLCVAFNLVADAISRFLRHEI